MADKKNNFTKYWDKFKVVLDKSFEDLYPDYINKGHKKLTNDEKEYSFLSRTLVLRKVKPKPIVKKSKKKIVERRDEGRTTVINT